MRGMELIRPLYFTREQSVLDWAEYCGLTFLPCDCPAKSWKATPNARKSSS